MEYWYTQLEACGKGDVVKELRSLLPSRFWARVAELVATASSIEASMRVGHSFDHPMTAKEADAYRKNERYLEVLRGIAAERDAPYTMRF